MTIQFESVVEGDVIRIPKRYVKDIPRTVSVTILFEENKMEPKMLTLDDFSEMKLDTRGFKFDREEANERR